MKSLFELQGGKEVDDRIFATKAYQDLDYGVKYHIDYNMGFVKDCIETVRECGMEMWLDTTLAGSAVKAIVKEVFVVENYLKNLKGSK